MHCVETSDEADLVMSLPSCIVQVQGTRRSEFFPRRCFYGGAVQALVPCYTVSPSFPRFRRLAVQLGAPQSATLIALLAKGQPVEHAIYTGDGSPQLAAFWAHVLATTHFDRVPYRLAVSEREAERLCRKLDPLGVHPEPVRMSLDELNSNVARLKNQFTVVLID